MISDEELTVARPNEIVPTNLAQVDRGSRIVRGVCNVANGFL